MITSRTFLIFGDDWGRLPSTIQHFGRILARHNRVFWVGSLGHRAPSFGLADIGRLFEKGKQMLAPPEPAAEKIPVTRLNPFVIPFHDTAWVREHNRRNVPHALREALQQAGAERTIVLTSSPVAGLFLGQLDESSFHYICLDDNTRFEGAFKCLGPMETTLVGRADSSWFISQGLLKSRGLGKPTSHFLPQGIDVEHFRSARALRDARGTNAKPVIGYHGLIASYVDVRMIEAAAVAHPEFHFLIVGKSTVDFPAASTPSNVEWVGEVPYARLPEFISRFDVGLIPFVVNELTLASNPLKFLEYCSMGIPVVSTPLPEVQKFGEIVHIGEPGAEYISKIGEAAVSENADLRWRRIQVSEEHSWESIVGRVCDEIEALEGAKR